MIALVANSFPWADQACERCHKVRPIAELTAVTINGTLVGWICREGHDE